MTWTSAIEHIVILLASFAIGIAAYIGISKETFKVKKKRLDWLFSITIQLVIYIWIAKVIVLFNLVIKDPFAVLAYPSNATILYLALIFTSIHIAVHIKKNVLPVNEMVEVFVPVLLSTQFIYVCIQLLQTGRIGFFINAAIVMVLLLIYITVDRVHTFRGSVMMFLAWAVGRIILSIVYAHKTLFGYLVSPLLYVVLGIGAILLLWKFKGERKF